MDRYRREIPWQVEENERWDATSASFRDLKRLSVKKLGQEEVPKVPAKPVMQLRIKISNMFYSCRLPVAIKVI